MVLSRWSIVVIVLALGLGSAVVASSRKAADLAPLPPLGKRLYSLGDQQSAAAVVIGPAKAAKADRYMRDPDQPGRLRVAPAPPKVVALPPQPKEKAANLRFRRLRVSGHLQQPRVAFKLERLPLERADEPVRRDFYPKVFEPARDDAF